MSWPMPTMALLGSSRSVRSVLLPTRLVRGRLSYPARSVCKPPAPIGTYRTFQNTAPLVPPESNTDEKTVESVQDSEKRGTSSSRVYDLEEMEGEAEPIPEWLESELKPKYRQVNKRSDQTNYYRGQTVGVYDSGSSDDLFGTGQPGHLIESVRAEEDLGPDKMLQVPRPGYRRKRFVVRTDRPIGWQNRMNLKSLPIYTEETLKSQESFDDPTTSQLILAHIPATWTDEQIETLVQGQVSNLEEISLPRLVSSKLVGNYKEVTLQFSSVAQATSAHRVLSGLEVDETRLWAFFANARQGPLREINTIRIRGLPASISLGDLRNWFEEGQVPGPLPVKYFLYSRGPRPDGQASAMAVLLLLRVSM